MIAISHWYRARSDREKRLLQMMAAIAVPLLIWLLLVVPLGKAYDNALESHLKAVDRNGRVKALADYAARSPSTVPTAVTDLALFLTDGARQRGITAEARPGPAPGSATISIVSSAAPAALDWLRVLEAAGYRLSGVRIAPSGDGMVTVTATVSGPSQ